MFNLAVSFESEESWMSDVQKKRSLAATLTNMLGWQVHISLLPSLSTAEEIQTLLLVSVANSPHAMTASLLARCLASRLTHSPQVISTLAMGAGIVTSVMSSVLTTNASFGWIALQTGVALMGSVAGSLGVQKLPDAGRWGFNQAARVTGYLGSRMSFWSSDPGKPEVVSNPPLPVFTSNCEPVGLGLK
jgi:hypothetical protein